MEQFSLALLDAYRRRTELARLVRFKLDRNLDTIAGSGPLDATVFDLIERADAEGWALELMAAALQDRPGNRQLRQFAETNWLALNLRMPGSLETVIRARNKFIDVEPWIHRLLELSSQICRVEVQASGMAWFGTGFLVGPGLVLTNQHVVAPALRAAADPTVCLLSTVGLLFDYKQLADGTTLNPGTYVTLHSATQADWLVAESPPSPADVSDTVTEPDLTELDFALLRVADEAVRQRGWIALPDDTPTIAPGDPLLILQHPSTRPLKLAIDTDSVVSVNINRTRMRYVTNTEGGSSGSPCFDAEWNLIALHQAGDPNFEYQGNQGIPIDTIGHVLRQRGVPLGDPAGRGAK